MTLPASKANLTVLSMPVHSYSPVQNDSDARRTSGPAARIPAWKTCALWALGALLGCSGEPASTTASRPHETLNGATPSAMPTPDVREATVSATIAPQSNASERALDYLSRLPDEQFRVDTAVALFEASRCDSLPGLTTAWERALKLANRDDDHPMHGLWDSAASFELSKVRQRAPLPVAGDQRSIFRGMDRVMAEAVACEARSLPAEVPAFIAEQLVDDGGYLTTHAIWTIQRLRVGSCIDEEQAARLLEPHQRRLLAALAAPRDASSPVTTLEADLLAEQIAMARAVGVTRDELTAPYQRLLDAQRPDGGFGTSQPQQNSRLEVHATAVAIWALVCCGSSEVPREETPATGSLKAPVVP